MCPWLTARMSSGGSVVTVRVYDLFLSVIVALFHSRIEASHAAVGFGSRRGPVLFRTLSARVEFVPMLLPQMRWDGFVFRGGVHVSPASVSGGMCGIQRHAARGSQL